MNTKGYVLGKMDNLFLKKYKKLFKKCNLYNGWGSVKRYKQFLEFMKTKDRKILKIEPKCVQSDKKEGKELWKFLSPMSELLRQGEKYMYYMKMGRKDSKTMVIMLPANGEIGFEHRLNIAKQLVKKNISSYLVQFPGYKYRMSSNQVREFGIAWSTMNDYLIQTKAMINEVRSMINYYSKQYDKIVIAGFSGGGSMGLRVALSNCFKNKNIPPPKLGFVGMMISWKIYSKKVLKSSINRKLSLLSDCPMDDTFQYNEDPLEMFTEISDHFFYNFDKDKENIKASVDEVILVEASHDHLVTKKNKEKTRGIIKRTFTQQKKDPEKHFEVHEFTGGHATGFTTKGSNIYRDMIVSCAEKLDYKFILS